MCRTGGENTQSETHSLCQELNYPCQRLLGESRSSRRPRPTAAPQGGQWDRPHGSPRPPPLHSVWATRLVPSGSFQAARPSSPQGQLYFLIPAGHSWSLGAWGSWSLPGTFKTLFSLLFLPDLVPVSHTHLSVFLSQCSSKSIWSLSLCQLQRGCRIWLQVSNLYCNSVCALRAEGPWKMKEGTV